MHVSELEYFLRISNHLAGEVDIQSALRAVKAEIDKIITVDHLDICLMDEANRTNRSYEVGLSTFWSTRRTLVSRSPVRDVLLGKTDSMLSGDATKDSRYIFPGAISGPITQHGLRSRINVAMKVLGRTVGALNCSSRQVDYYTEENLQKVKILADILAPYFFALRSSEDARRQAVRRARAESKQEGLRVGALRLTHALEAERQRIGMDLHDQTLAELTRLARRLTPEMTESETADLRSDMHACIQHLREIIDSSIPSILELFGFEEAVRSHFESAGGAVAGLTFQYEDQTNGEIDKLRDTVRTALFRIAQEAINNTLRHAQASQINVLVSQSPEGTLAMTIRDNGSFKARVDARLGGINHMQTRAQLIGASFEVKDKDGTEIGIRLEPEILSELRHAHSFG